VPEKKALAFAWTAGAAKSVQRQKCMAEGASRVHALDHGRTLAPGPVEQVLSDPNVIRAYLGGAA